MVFRDPSIHLTSQLATHPLAILPSSSPSFHITVQLSINRTIHQKSNHPFSKTFTHQKIHPFKQPSTIKPSIHLAIVPSNQVPNLSFINHFIHLTIYQSSHPSNQPLIHPSSYPSSNLSSHESKQATIHPNQELAIEAINHRSTHPFSGRFIKPPSQADIIPAIRLSIHE